MTESFDLLVIGAGPAGCAAAITAAGQGLRVGVIDKAVFPRDKICGDGLTTNALRYLDRLGVSLSEARSTSVVSDVLLRSPYGREVHLALPDREGQGRRYASVVQRAELDQALFEAASGVADVRGGWALDALELTAHGARATVSARGSTHRLDAPWVIAADGMWSPTRRALGLAVPGYRGDWHGFRQYFHGVTGDAARALVVSFEPDILPGYFWAFPLADGRANVGFGVQRPGLGVQTKVENVQRMAGLWPQILQRPHIREFLGEHAEAESQHRAWPIPARISQVPLVHGRVLFVGDAAAACDPMTGEGIGQALQTGVSAAEAVAAYGIDPTHSPADRYARGVRRTLLPDHRIAHLLVRALAHRRGVEAAFALIDTNGWTRRNFARWLFEDYPRATLGTPHRWRSLLPSHSGAAT